jgi:predicted anti-sigma-YlaC factor YlaD
MSRGRDKLDCSACEQRILDAEDSRVVLTQPSVAEHLAECTACGEFFESFESIKPVLNRYQVREPTEELMETVFRRALEAHSAGRIPEATPIHAGMLRVLLAGLVSLPLVIMINGLMGWALYEVAVSLLPRTVALYCLGLFVAWASLAVSLGYASLPLLDALVRKPVDSLPMMSDP